jgi:hypothetical protein
MNSRPVAALCAALAAGATAFAAKSTSDLLPPARRQATVDLAHKLTQPSTPTAVPADFKSPFNPADFDKPSPDEVKGPRGAKGEDKAEGGAPKALPPGDREMLESLAARIGNTSAVQFRGKTLLVVGSAGGRSVQLEVGQVFTVTNPANGQDYDLELTAIDRTTFTLRYRGEEITRPLRLTK